MHSLELPDGRVDGYDFAIVLLFFFANAIL